MATQARNVIRLPRGRGDVPPAAGELSGQTRTSAATSRLASARPRVLIITEGTYPYAVGGVSSWCDAVIGGLGHIDWEVLPIVAGSKRRQQSFELPANARLRRPIELWSQDPGPRRRPGRGGAGRRLQRPRPDSSQRPAASIPEKLLRGLLPWQGDLDELTDALIHCRRCPADIRRAFRGRDSWQRYLAALEVTLALAHEDAAPAPVYDAIEAARLYQLLYWVARTAAVPTPSCELLHVTAAGWATIPALVHKALHGTPLLLTEHGVYVREPYLASVRNPAVSRGERHMATRVALGLTRAAYAAAEVIAPVTEANQDWERGLGADPAKIRVIPNGIHPRGEPAPALNTMRVIAMGRVDPLKDVQTMLLVADEVIRRLPEARFEYWGPPTPGEELYARACERMLRQLELGEGFRFMGRTTDPHGVIRSGNLVLMTSISEAMPMTLLEAMAQGRPAVATSVGGVPGVLRGCGIVEPPGDVHRLATAVVTLLRNPELAAQLGRRGYERLHERYTLQNCAQGYGTLIDELVAGAAA